MLRVRSITSAGIFLYRSLGILFFVELKILKKQLAIRQFYNLQNEERRKQRQKYNNNYIFELHDRLVIVQTLSSVSLDEKGTQLGWRIRERFLGCVWVNYKLKGRLIGQDAGELTTLNETFGFCVSRDHGQNKSPKDKMEKNGCLSFGSSI